MALYGEVLRTEQLTPQMVRITFGGDGLDEFTPTGHTDQYVNAQFIPDGAPYSVPFDLDTAREGDPSHRPRGRRYTIRRWDPAAREVTIDFVVHGDVGHAGRWATHAQPGDRLQMLGPSGGYQPDPTADWHLMVGDESALPAIAASLESAPAGARVLVVAVVDDVDGQVPLESPADVAVTWVHRSAHRDDPEHLLHAVEALEFPAGRVHAFVHGEATEVRAVRKHLLGDRGVPKDGQSISPYWRRDYTDERWREVKRDWLAESEMDVQTG